MKYCSKCGGKYLDATLNFCLHDGGILKSIPNDDETQTIVRNDNEIQTVVRNTRQNVLPTKSKADLREYNLVCPLCNSQNLFPVDLNLSSNEHKCPKCRYYFSSRIVKVRSKNSRHVTKRNKNSQQEERHFSIRVKDFRGGEDLIEFVNAGRKDFEFRSGDTVAFTYKHPIILRSLRGKKLALVQNLNINQWMKITSNPNWVSVVLTVILILFIIWLCKMCSGT